MLARLTIVLCEDERLALRTMAETECRIPREQLRYWLRQEAHKRGLLNEDRFHQHTMGEQGNANNGE